MRVLSADLLYWKHALSALELNRNSESTSQIQQNSDSLIAPPVPVKKIRNKNYSEENSPSHNLLDLYVPCHAKYEKTGDTGTSHSRS